MFGTLPKVNIDLIPIIGYLTYNKCFEIHQSYRWTDRYVGCTFKGILMGFHCFQYRTSYRNLKQKITDTYSYWL